MENTLVYLKENVEIVNLKVLEMGTSFFKDVSSLTEL